jgi:hypothetical protein
MIMVLSFPQYQSQMQSAASDTTAAASKDLTSYQSSAAGSTATADQSSSQTAQASPAPPASTPGVVYTWQGKDVLLIPADDAASFDRSSAGGRDIMVIVPYDQYHPAVQGTASGSSSFPGFDRNHVLLLVPADQLKNFSQLSTSDKQAFVVMPLDQFNQMAAAGTASSAVQPSREPTSYQAPSTTDQSALPQAYGDTARRVFLNEAGEATAIQETFPAAGGDVIVLRDGTHLLVPNSVNIRGDFLKAGNRVRGEYEQRGGENLVTWLEVYQQSGGDVQ